MRIGDFWLEVGGWKLEAGGLVNGDAGMVAMTAITLYFIWNAFFYFNILIIK